MNNQPRTEPTAEPATETAVATAEPQQTLPAIPQRKAPLVAGHGVQAIIPQDIEQVFRLAGAIAAANMAPKSYNRDANAIMVGILHGMEVGFTPMAALQSIAVVNGMPSIWGDGALGLIQASGLLEDMKEWADEDGAGGLVYHCHMKRRGQPTWTEQKFSWEDAKTAKLVGKDTYQQHGRRMLQRRARARCMADGFSDVLRGLHIRETLPAGELQEQEDGSYAPATPPRPIRQPEREVTEEVRQQTYEMDRSFRDTMREDAKPEAETLEDPAEPTLSKSDAQKSGPAIKKAIVAADTEEALAAISDSAELKTIEHHLPRLFSEIGDMIEAKRGSLTKKK